MRSEKEKNSSRGKSTAEGSNVDVIPQKLSKWPHKGYFGAYGGQEHCEDLLPALTELEEAFREFKMDDNLQRELRAILTDYAGRQTSLYCARRLSQSIGGARIYFKREDLAHNGLIDINNALTQVLLARRLRKKKLVSAVLSPKQGLALAMASRLYGIETKLYMGQETYNTYRDQVHDLGRIKEMGTHIQTVSEQGGGVLGALSATYRDWSANHSKTFMAMMLPVGPHPFPWIVRECQRVIGDEIKGQILRKERRLPDQVVVLYESGSEVLGAFAPFVDDEFVKCVCVEAMKDFTTSQNAILNGKEGVHCGMKSLYFERSSEFPATGHYYEQPAPIAPPEMAFYHENGRMEYFQVTNQQAKDAYKQVLRSEGFVPSRDAAHVLHAVIDRAKNLGSDGLIVGVVAGLADDTWLDYSSGAQRPQSEVEHKEAHSVANQQSERTDQDQNRSIS